MPGADASPFSKVPFSELKRRYPERTYRFSGVTDKGARS